MIIIGSAFLKLNRHQLKSGAHPDVSDTIYDFIHSMILPVEIFVLRSLSGMSARWLISFVRYK